MRRKATFSTCSAISPTCWQERASLARTAIDGQVSSKQQAFLEFVLGHYVGSDVDELDTEKLGTLLRLRYRDSIADANRDLGKPEEINKVFVGFQKYLYLPGVAKQK